MDVNTIVTLISSVGFPIFACVACGWYIKQKDADHKAEMEKFADALNNNTMVIQKLLDKMDKIAEVKWHD